MTVKANILARLSGTSGEGVLYLPDLTLWYHHHHSRGTLPDKWQNSSLPEVARSMGAPIWYPVQPWRLETKGAEVTITEQGRERIIRSETRAGSLTARWVIGPNGEWWQTEYPVKSEADLLAALELVQARTYSPDPAGLEQAAAQVGEDGLVAIEIPRRPYSDLLHEFLGWSEGLLLLNEPPIQEMMTILETKLQQLVQEIALLPGRVVFSPDNLDGQFISPGVFRQHLAGSYRATVDTLGQHDKQLLVHVGGPIKRLLPALAETGIAGVEGIAGPPQSDLSPAEARELVGAELALWGGIPQDFLLAAHEAQSFEMAVRQAAREARADPRLIVGIADRVPIDADLGRLEAIPALVSEEDWR